MPGRQRLAQQQIDRALEEIPEDPTAVVTQVQPGAARDGLALVTVNYLGATLRVRYLTQYTPVVGHLVVLRRNGGDLYILGRLGGYTPLGG
jgi:uncharacterized iron-regulated membrane protein